MFEIFGEARTPVLHHLLHRQRHADEAGGRRNNFQFAVMVLDDFLRDREAVYKQPESPDEEKLCKEAMEGCPVEAIGNNG